jgi:magnesium chelatase family protein
LEKWEIVGLPDISVRESKERVRAAIKNSGYELHGKRILINLAPAEIKKEGAVFDLAIAIGILSDIGIVRNRLINNYAFLGELSLDGTLNSISGILPMCIELKRLGIKKVIVPIESTKEAAIVKGLEVYGAESLRQVVDFLNGDTTIEKEESNAEELLKKDRTISTDFDEVIGQENVKRALEIAAARRP